MITQTPRGPRTVDVFVDGEERPIASLYWTKGLEGFLRLHGARLKGGDYHFPSNRAAYARRVRDEWLFHERLTGGSAKTVKMRPPQS